MNNQNEIRIELQEIAPKFSSLEKKNTQRAPENYFNEFPDRMLNIVKEQPTTETWIEKLEKTANSIFSLIFQPKYAIPVSFSVLLLIVLLNLFNSNNQASYLMTHIQEVSDEELEEYLVENFDAIDLVAFGTIDAIQGELLDKSITDEELNNYLLQNFDEQIITEEIL